MIREGAPDGGRRPLFGEPLHVGRPNVGSHEAFTRRVDAMLERGWLTNDGPYVREFEQQIAHRIGVRHAVAMCNGTIALQIAIRSAGLSGEVIVPSFTFVATAHALTWMGLTPVFCDIDPTTHNIDPARVEALITERTSGILGVHLWGRPCDVPRLEEIARAHELTLMFDAAHAFDCSRGDRMVGGFGLAEVLSFHATKFIQSFEGGAVVTNDDELADSARLMRNFGFVDYDAVAGVGLNAKMPEVCAAMGITSLESVDEFTAVNHENHRLYRERLAGVEGLSVMEYDDAQRANRQYVIVEIDPEISPVTRDELHAALWADNVLARRYFWPGCHRMRPYSDADQPCLESTEALSERVLALPTGMSVGAEAIDAIGGIMERAMSAGSRPPPPS